jgi:hypothetical protein
MTTIAELRPEELEVVRDCAEAFAVRLAVRAAVAEDLAMLATPYAIRGVAPFPRARLVLEWMRREGLALEDEHQLWHLTAKGRDLAAMKAGNIAADFFRRGIKSGWNFGNAVRQGVDELRDRARRR